MTAFGARHFNSSATTILWKCPGKAEHETYENKSYKQKLVPALHIMSQPHILSRPLQESVFQRFKAVGASMLAQPSAGELPMQ